MKVDEKVFSKHQQIESISILKDIVLQPTGIYSRNEMLAKHSKSINVTHIKRKRDRLYNYLNIYKKLFSET